MTTAPSSNAMHGIKVQDLSALELALILRSHFKIRTHLLRISNCPMKAKDIHRLWSYIKHDLGYKVGALPFAADATLSDNALEWAHEESTTKRPLFICDANLENQMLFHSTVLTASGRTHPGWETDASVSSSFPMYSEHRMTLSTMVPNPKSKRLEAQTRLVQIQPTLIFPQCEQYWSPLLIVSGLGTAYSSSKSCITGAVHAHLKGLLTAVDPDYENRYYRSVQLDWTNFQFTTINGERRTQPIATLRICKNDPDDQSAEALQFARKIGPLILGHIFETNSAAQTTHSFCKFLLRVHRVDRSGTTQPLGSTLRRDLMLPPPSDNLYRVTLQNLTPYPSLPLIHQRLLLIGLTGIENIAYSQTESTRTARQNRLEWMNTFQVSIFFNSVGNALALLHPHNQSHLSQCLAPLLEDSNVPLIMIPPGNLPLVSPSDPMPTLRFPITYPAQPALQKLYRIFPISSIYQQYAHPSPRPSSLPTEAPTEQRESSPKRARPQPESTRTSSPQPLQPTDRDRRMYEDITTNLQILYRRLPTDTYLFVSDMLDQLKEQITEDGLLGDPDPSQIQAQSPHVLESQSTRSLSQHLSHSQLDDSATEFEENDI